jgi:hypothetical protein
MNSLGICRKFLFSVLVVTLAVSLLPQTSSTQEIFGKILGTVTDPKNAVISGAKITITNENTGVSATLPTDDRGDYIFTRVLPGVYTIRVENAGFRTILQKAVTVSVAKDSRADFTMEVGAVTETVTVSENIKQVETTSMQLSASIPGQAIVNLPLNGRNWINLARTLPGVTAASADRFGLPSVSGGRTQSNNYLINGIDYNDLPLNTPQAAPSPDSIAEFRIITNSMNPEYSRNSAATLNAITKSGSNSFHGAAFWFHRDHGLNAADFFINKAGARKPDFSQQQYGGVVGGPLYKNHTFWFVSYQGLRQGIPQDNGLQRVPTPGERSGIFMDNTGLAARTTPLSTKPIPFSVIGSPASTVCPSTTCPAGTSWRNAFPLVGGSVTIPTANFNPVALNLLKFYPLPSTGQNTYSAVGTQTGKDAQFSTRIDQNWKRDQLFGYFFWRDNTSARPFSFTGGLVPGFGDQSVSFNRQIAITEVHTFNSTTINEFRIGYNRLRFLAVSPQTIIQPSALGFTGITPQHTDVASAPLVSITGFAAFGFSNNGPQPRVDATFHYSDSFSKIWRGHNFKIGIDNRRGKIINPFDFGNNGVFSIGNTTGPFASGFSLINFLMGVPSSYSQNTGALNAAKTEEYYSYVQDTWRIASTFTLVYGLGYQVDTPYKQLDNFGVAQVAFRPGRLSTVYPTAPPGILYTGDPGIPRGTVPTQWDNFAPRAGVVWSPSSDGFLHWLTGGKGDFSIRAGAGIFYNLTEGEASLQFLGNPPLGVQSFGVNDVTAGTSPSFANPFASVNSIPIGAIPAVTTANRFPAPTAPPIGSTTVDFSQFEPFSINILDPRLRAPRSYNFNLTIERQIKDLLLRASYVGSQGRNLYNTGEANPVNTVRCATAPAVFIPALGITSTCADLDPFTQFYPGITPLDGLVYGSLGLQQSIATSHYNSFQFTAEKRYSHGLFIRGTYTFSKSIDNASSLEGDGGVFQGMTPGNPKRDQALSSFDARHIAAFTYDWELPLPKPSNPILNRLLQKWAITGITSFQSGFPVFVRDVVSDSCLAGNGLLFYSSWCRPNFTGTPVQITDPRASSNNRYFNTTAFVIPGPGDIGNVPRNAVHGPGLNNWDFAIRKATYINETMYFELRGEFYNAWNHAQFNNPSGTITSGLFGRVTSTRQGPRVIQLGLKFYF